MQHQHVTLHIRKRMPRAKPHYVMLRGTKYTFSYWTQQTANYIAKNGSIIRIQTMRQSDMRFVKKIFDTDGEKLEAIDAYRH